MTIILSVHISMPFLRTDELPFMLQQEKNNNMDPQFDQFLKQTGEYGFAYQVSHPIVFIEGLPKVRTHEVIIFETGQKGEVFTINRGKIEARMFSHKPVKVGTKVTRTDQLLSIGVGRE